MRTAASAILLAAGLFNCALILILRAGLHRLLYRPGSRTWPHAHSSTAFKIQYFIPSDVQHRAEAHR